MIIQPAQQPQGFTLVELAVVLVLIGIVTTMGLKMVTATLGNASYSETKSKQVLIKTALIGYLIHL
jgi:prepilin-type N-terminal cleavage/methylation domain-containing protein